MLKTFVPNKPDADGWITLRFGSDWGGRYLAREPYEHKLTEFHMIRTMAEARGEAEPAAELGYDRRANCRRAYVLEEGARVRVRLTNGVEREATIAVKYEVDRESDMGRSYTTRKEIPYADFGDGTHAELDRVQIRYERERDPTAAELDAEPNG